MQCLSPLQLYQFARGTIEDPQRHEAIAAHVAQCATCEQGVEQARAPVSSTSDSGISLADALEPLGGETVSLGPLHVDEDSATLGMNSGGLQTPSSSGWSSTVHSKIPRGTPIGRYLVVEPLGSGGLGDVYTSYDPELDRCVAIKVLRPTKEEADGSGSVSGSATGSGSGSDRLMREAKALARLSHPNVVAVYDVGRVGEDVFIAMERIEGITLSKWYRAERRPWKEVRDVFLGMGAGVAAAHDAGIVHRDLKPQNVIVSADGRPRVLDFGLARAVRSDERSGLISLPNLAGLDLSRSRDSLDEITMAGTVMGTPQYMAPEQFEQADTIGPAADQFSFCVALWVALYDQRPFQGEGVIGLVRAVYAGQVVEPEDRRGVPGWPAQGAAARDGHRPGRSLRVDARADARTAAGPALPADAVVGGGPRSPWSRPWPRRSWRSHCDPR